MSSECSVCRLPRASGECGACGAALCKACGQSPPPGSFELLPAIPPELAHRNYCPSCYDSRVEPALAGYGATLERARDVDFWPKSYRGAIPVLRKGRERVSVADRRDRSEVLLALGFRAAELGFNGLIDGEVSSRKVRNHGYQKMLWSGSALPCEIDRSRLPEE